MAVQATARLKYVSIPPRKMRLVAKLVKGLPIEKAIDILNFTPKIAAHHMAKTLKSAAANALSLEGTDNLKPEDLFVKNIIVDEAPTQKRVRFQSMGRVYRYRKRFSHLTVILEEQAQAVAVAQAARVASKTEDEVKVDEKKPAKKKTAAKSKAKGEAEAKAKPKAKAKTADAKSEDKPKAKAKSKPKAKADDKTGDKPSDKSK